MLAVKQDDLREIGDAAHFGHAKHEVEVFGDQERMAEAAEFLSGVAVHERGAEVAADFVFHDFADGFVVFGERVGTDGQALGIGEGTGAADPDQAGVAGEAIELKLQPARGHEIVRVMPGDEFAAGHGQEFVAGFDEAAVGAGARAGCGSCFGSVSRSAAV